MTTEVTPDDPKTPFHDARKKGRFAKEPTGPRTITVYAAVAFKDDQGEHAEGSPLTMPYDTPAEQAEVDTMVRYGVLSKTKP